MKQIIYFALFIALLGTACNTEPVKTEERELSQAEKMKMDSLSKAEQRVKADSLKKTNPLLIVPPDSTYTGDYTDKYSSGITKFKGFFRFGKRHGQWMSFYPSGLLWSEMNYDKGIENGPNMTYFFDGKPRYTGFYKNGMKDSLWTFYDSLGHPLKKAIYKKGHMMQETSLR